MKIFIGIDTKLEWGNKVCVCVCEYSGNFLVPRIDHHCIIKLHFNNVPGSCVCVSCL